MNTLKSAVSILILAGMAAAAVIKVPTDYPTITEALSYSAAGDSVLVAEGLYPEAVVLDKNDVTLLGGFEAAAWTRDLEQYETVIEGPGTGNTVTINNVRGTMLEGFSISGGQTGITVYAEGSGAVSGIYTESFETGTAGWMTGDLTGGASLWKTISSHPAVTPAVHSGTNAWWCGESVYYRNNMNDMLVLEQVFDLTAIPNPHLRFWHLLDKDPNDRALVDISMDNGATWINGAGTYTSVSSWVQTDLNLSPFVSDAVKIRFRFNSDAYNPRDYYGWFLDDITVISVTPETEIYGFDFETGAQGFTHYGVQGNDTWGLSTARANSGSQSFKASEGVSNWAALQSPELDFSALTNPKLYINNWYRFALGEAEGNWSNGGIVEISTDPDVPAADWVKIYPVGGYPGYCYLHSYGNPLGDNVLTGDADNQGFYGFQANWDQVMFDLSAYAGQPSVWIRFSTGSDLVGWGYENWYLDDVTVKEVGGENVAYLNDLEDGAAALFTPQEVACGDWWCVSDPSFEQPDGLPVAATGQTALFCGNQNSQNGNGTYDFADNANMLLNNTVTSPLIDISGIMPFDGLTLRFAERRRVSSENAFCVVEARPDAAADWQVLRTSMASTFGEGREGGWETATLDLGSLIGADAVQVRFRTETTPGFSHVYWYVDDVTVEKTDNLAATISWCTVRDNQDGITAAADAGLLVSNCTVVRNSGTGITADGTTGLVSASILWDNGIDVTGMLVIGSDVQDAVAGIQGVLDAVSDDGNISADPLFADEAGNDFRLMPQSPAIGMGAWSVLEEVPVEQQFALFRAAVADLPAEAFVGDKHRRKMLDKLEKTFAEDPGLKKGKLLKVWEKLQTPLYQELLLKRLDNISEKFVARNKYKKAARKLERQVLVHMDGKGKKGGNDWITADYQAAIYEEGLALHGALLEAAAAERDKEEQAAAKIAAAVPEPELPQVAESFSNYPNPVRERTTISYILTDDRQVRVAIYRTDGAMVTELVDGNQAAGTYHVVWDRTDDHHRTVKAGTYLCALYKGALQEVRLIQVIE